MGTIAPYAFSRIKQPTVAFFSGCAGNVTPSAGDIISFSGNSNGNSPTDATHFGNGQASQTSTTSSRVSLNDPLLTQALQHLKDIQNDPYDERTVKQLGIQPPFHSGKDAIKLIQQKGIQIVFGDMGDSPAHAEWQTENNRIVLNQKYRHDTSLANTLALSEAIYHEAGHAAGKGDGESSIQEELNCLALNALGYRYHANRYPDYAAAGSTSPLIANGVALYSRLFFDDPDPSRRALIKRVELKYGDLPLESPGHAAPKESTCVARRVALLHAYMAQLPASDKPKPLSSYPSAYICVSA